MKRPRSLLKRCESVYKLCEDKECASVAICEEKYDKKEQDDDHI